MILSTPSASAIRNSHPKFGRVHLLAGCGTVEVDTPDTDGEVMFHKQKIGTSKTAQVLTQTLRDKKLSVRDLKNGILKILGENSDLNTSSSDPAHLQEYNECKQYIQKKIEAPISFLYTDLLGIGNTTISIGLRKWGMDRSTGPTKKIEQSQQQRHVKEILKLNNSTEFLSLLSGETENGKKKEDIFGDPIQPFKLSLTDRDSDPLSIRLRGNKDNFNLIKEQLGSEEAAEELITRTIVKDFEINLLRAFEGLPQPLDENYTDTKEKALKDAKAEIWRMASQQVEQNRIASRE